MYVAPVLRMLHLFHCRLQTCNARLTVVFLHTTFGYQACDIRTTDTVYYTACSKVTQQAKSSRPLADKPHAQCAAVLTACKCAFATSVSSYNACHRQAD